MPAPPGSGGTSPYPRCIDADVATAAEAMDDDAREWFEERCGILAEAANLERAETERQALVLTRRWLARQRDRPDVPPG